MSIPSLDMFMEDARDALQQASGRARTYERHVSTLLGYLDSVVARHPDALTETARVVCASIARDIGSAAFTPPTSASKKG